MAKRILASFLSLMLLSTTALAAEITLDQLAVKDSKEYQRSMASSHEATEMKKVAWYKSRVFWAWTTMALLGGTALTGKEMKVTSTHKSLAMFSTMSYGAFAYADLFSEGSGHGSKWSNAGRWLHIPAMLLLPVAGAIAERQFDRGASSASGLGSIHKPAALAAVLGMALTTISLTWDF